MSANEDNTSGGGADGSMLLFPTVEPGFHANAGIDDSVNNLIPFLAKYPDISAGDLVQFAGAVALSNCPVSVQMVSPWMQIGSYAARVPRAFSSSPAARTRPRLPLTV